MKCKKKIQTTWASGWAPGPSLRPSLRAKNKKKICAVFIEIRHWRFFDKNTAVTFYNVSAFLFCDSTMTKQKNKPQSAVQPKESGKAKSLKDLEKENEII